MKHYLWTFIACFFCILALSTCKSDRVTEHEDWPVYLGDKSSSQYSMLNQVNTKNVQQLKIAWVYHTGDATSSSQIQCNPIEIAGTLYGTSPQLKLFALDAATGKLKWSFDPFSDTISTRKRINVNRGVTYWSDGDDHRILYTAGDYLFAVNAITGKLISGFGNNGKTDLHDGLDREVHNLLVKATSPGIIYKDLFIIGSSLAEDGKAAPGHIRAYDVRTGKRKWIFHTIPHPGEFGYDTWVNRDAWKNEYVGGANNWAGMSLDEKRGIVYVPTGSATFDFYGGLRKGENLFANTVLALDAATGKRIWHFQTIHHDLWDRDLPAPPNLVTVNHNGKKVDAVAQVTKTGYIFVFDRYTGKPLFPVNEMPVPTNSELIGEEPWPTQPVPELPKPFTQQNFSDTDINNLVSESSQNVIREKLAQLNLGNMFLPPSEKGMVIFPGFDGGAEWGGAAYDPRTGILYVNANQIPWTLTMIPSTEKERRGGKTLAEHGKIVYSNHCMACHGRELEGGGRFPSLQQLDKKFTANQVLGIIDNGRGGMPSFKELPEDDKKSLLSFLLKLKNGAKPYLETSNKAVKEAKPNKPVIPYTMTGYPKLRTPEGYPANKPPWGTLTAINLNNGETMWQIPLGEYPELAERGIPITGTENYGGPVVTKGGLVFIAATLDKKIRAFDKTTGKLLWEARLPAAGYATPSVYKVNGKQYIVIACGGGKLGTSSGDTYVAFALP